MPLQPWFPSQPNPNPNNKVVHQFEIVNMPSYSITPVPCNDVHLRPGRRVEPLVIEDAPYFATEERMNQQYPFNTTIPNIEDVASPTEIPTETKEETLIETHAT